MNDPEQADDALTKSEAESCDTGPASSRTTAAKAAEASGRTANATHAADAAGQATRDSGRAARTTGGATNTTSRAAGATSRAARAISIGPAARTTLLAWLIAAAGAAAFIAYSVIQWRNFAVPSWDQGIFTQLAKRYANLESPQVDIKGPGFNLLGDHFHPILVLLAPFYRLFPSGLTLLAIQDLLFAVSAVPIIKLAAGRLGRLAAALIGIGYLFGWGLWGAVASQFHEIAFGVPLLAYGLCAWIDSQGRSRLALASIAMLVFVKEDLGLTVAAFGAILVWQEWGRATAEGDFQVAVRSWASLKAAASTRLSKTGWALIAWGVFWFVFTVAVFLPLFNPEGAWDYTGRLAESEASTSNILLRLFQPGIKFITFGLLVAAAGIVGAASPYFWLTVPTLAWRFLGNVEFYWGWEWHYSAILMPMVAVALIDICTRLRARRVLIAGAVAVSLVSSLAMAINGPLGHFWRGQPYAVASDRVEAARGAIDEVGSGRKVVTGLRFLAYLVPDNTVYWEGSVGKADVDTVVFDPSMSASKSWVTADEWARRQFGGRWRLVYARDWFQVAVREG
ncbi:MAG: DUF2079 domain-containing protein [Actinomycetaceae bacterium]|nr:DUF2079 domain-containing protein [Actinomycetaceae bacterium]